MGAAGERAGGRPQAALGGPDPRRLQAAVDDVVERMRPGQIILFGSGAREEMSAGSDLGPALVVAGGGGGAAHAHERWRCEMDSSHHAIDRAAPVRSSDSNGETVARGRPAGAR